MIRRKIKVLVIMFVMCLGVMGCREEEKEIESMIEEKAENDILVSLDCRCDMEKMYNKLEELCDASEMVVQCKVMDMESYIKVGSSIYTDYSLKIQEVYKGNNIEKGDIVHMEMLGGRITGAKYLEQVEEEAEMIDETDFSQEELEQKYIEMLVNDVPLLEVGEIYVTFGKYNQNTQMYNSIGNYQGIFEEMSKNTFRRDLAESDVEGQNNVLYEISKKEVIQNCE